MSISASILAFALCGQYRPQGPAISTDRNGQTWFQPYPGRPDIRYGCADGSYWRPPVYGTLPAKEYVPPVPRPAGWPEPQWPPRSWGSDASLDWLEWALGGEWPWWMPGDRPGK